MRRVLVGAGLTAAVVVLSVLMTYMWSLIPVLDFRSGFWWTAVYSDSVEERVELEGLSREVRVLWDRYGVPHIYAENEFDAFAAFGYVQARDRLWQMDILRRLAEGRLSELFGERTLESDKFYRTMGLGRAAEKIYDALGEREREILRAFTRGVNAYIEKARSEPPFEYRVLGVSPEPWRPVDSLAIGRFMAWSLSGDLTDLIVWKLYSTYGPEFLEDIGFFNRPRTLTILEGWVSPLHEECTCRKQGYPDFSPLLHYLRYGSQLNVGSNSWVISPELSAVGVALLANDPHLSLTVPPIWYEAHLQVPGELDVRGVTFPGIPVIIIGMNRRVAWGFTDLGTDQLDLYYYVFSDDGEHYFYLDGWRDVRWVEEVIKVREGDGVREERLRIGYTVHGPIIEREGVKVAVRWVGHQPTHEFTAIYLMNKAETLEEFREAAALFDVPSQSLVHADVDGNIAYWATGLIPIRSGGMPWMPMNGSAGEGEWRGYIPFNKIPQAVNPPQGYIITANNMIVKSHRYYLGYGWADRYRAQRIWAMIEELKPLDLEELKRIQFDHFSIVYLNFKPLLNAIDAAQLSDLEREALNKLREWDGYMEPDEPGPTIFTFWLNKLERLVWEPILRGAGVEDVEELPLEFLEALLMGDAERWLTAEPEELALKAFREAVEELKVRLGEDVSEWRWIRVSRYTPKHVLGEVLEWLNYPPAPTHGGRETVNPTWGLESEGGASWRQVIALGKEAYSVLPGGQRGWRSSRHWLDQYWMWVEGKYKPMGLPGYGEVEAEAESVFIGGG